MGNNKSQPRTYLSEKDLCFLEANTAFKREKIIEWHNAFLHDCPEGILDKKQFVKLYAQLETGDKKVDKYAEFVFSAFDTDHSGKIEFTEFLIAFNIRSKGKIEDKLNWTFDVYDRNGDGVIDKKELKKMFSMLFTMLNVNKKDDKYNVDQRVDEILKKIDTSGDKALSREEFLLGMKDDEPLRKLLLDHEIEF